MFNLLLVTKFHISSVRSSWVSRDRLVGLLNQGMENRLTLVSAPAGFGKTTLLSDWAHQAGMAVSWLSLDEQDNHPIQFWTYIVGTLQRTHREIGEATLAMLRSTESIPFKSFLIPLINEIASTSDRIALVLDDYHLMTDERIHASLIFLLEHLPAQLHLIVASRVDPALPLARLRARGQLTELRSSDLRFTVAETATFLQSMKLPLSQMQIESLQARTEGWIAGLQMAALSMQDAEDFSA
jgi:LuxR family maltose regulon positive regulatory protein